jgi:hypothetical protein
MAAEASPTPLTPSTTPGTNVEKEKLTEYLEVHRRPRAERGCTVEKRHDERSSFS